MSNHAWCSDIPRDAAVRAAEDNRQGPLPTLEQCIETARAMMPKSVSATSAPKHENKGNGMRTERVTLEVTHGESFGVSHWSWVTILRLQSGESVRVVEEAKLAPAANAAAGSNHAAPAASGAANSPESPVSSEPVALAISPAERDGLQAIDDGLRRHGNGFVVIPGSDSYRAVRSILDRHTTAPPPARGWLTEEEREAVEYFSEFCDTNIVPDEWSEMSEKLRSLLARSSPPEVVLPDDSATLGVMRTKDVVAALAAAGVPCKEVGK